MNRNDAPGFGAGGTYQEGAPGTGLLASKVGAKQLNALQDELVNLLAGAGLSPDDADNGQVLAAMGILFSAGNTSAVLKNRAINGAFDLWQRGTSIAVANANLFTADRWVSNADPSAGAGTATVSRQDFALGQPDVPDGPLHYFRWVQTANAAGGPLLFQTFEDVARYSSGQLTVSFWARAGANLNAATRAIQTFGPSGSTAVTVGVQAIAVTTAWQRFVVTYTLPSVAGKTINPGSYLRVGVTLPPASTFTFEIADFQVEVGAAATAFDRRPEQIEFLLASRYYQKSYALDTAPGTLSRAGALQRFVPLAATAPSPCWNVRERFRVPMRATPSLTWFAPLGTVGNPGGPGKVSMNQLGVYLGVTVSATTDTTDAETGYPTRGDLSSGYPSTSAGFSIVAHWTADAELL